MKIKTRHLICMLFFSMIINSSMAEVVYGKISGIESSNAKSSEASAKQAIAELAKEGNYHWILHVKETTVNKNGKHLTTIIYKASKPGGKVRTLAEQIEHQRAMEKELGIEGLLGLKNSSPTQKTLKQIIENPL